MPPGHPAAAATTFAAANNSGDLGRDETGANLKSFSQSWYYLSGIDAVQQNTHGTLVAIGDSITDGAGSTADQNKRWPDQFAARLQSAGSATIQSVLNSGIGGNQVLTDYAGPSGTGLLDRLVQDVLQRANVTDVVLLEGTNDLVTMPMHSAE